MNSPRHRTPKDIFRIEGESVTLEEIGKRLGITSQAAGSRLRKLRGASGAITWLRLQAKKPKKVAA